MTVGISEAITPIIRYQSVQKIFDRAGSRTVALGGLSFEVQEGEYLCIVGRTGSGKSTTINLLLGLTAPTAGTVSVLGRDPYREFGALKGELACIFQGDRLLPWRTAVDNVRLPLEVLGLSERTLARTAFEWLELVGLKDFARAFPHELSGGMRQRVAMARALVSDPKIVLADEAFGHLDEVTGNRIKGDFKRLTTERGKTVVHITHSIDEAIELADRIIVLGARGSIVKSFRTDRAGLATGHLRREIYEQVQGTEVETPPEAMGI